MFLLDLYEEIKTGGNFLTIAGIADLHLLCSTKEKRGKRTVFQPLDPDSFNYLKYCFNELRNNPFYGKTISLLGGDTTELDRGVIRKIKKSYHKTDSMAEDQLRKQNLDEYVIPKLKQVLGNIPLVGGVGGNHIIEFANDDEGKNSEEYIINKFGGKYFGDGKALINFHFSMGGQKCLKKVLILHGNKAGTKQAIIRELKDIFDQYGKVDLVIKCHAHDPMTHFHCRYVLPDKETGRINKVETLVMCLGSTRAGEKIGYVDYTEAGNYQPHASRHPVAIFHAYKPASRNQSLEVKIRPYIM